MTILIVGASGATGRQLVEQLLLKNQELRLIVRSPEKLPESWKDNDNISIIHANISDLKEEEMAEYLADCDAVASCLGHTPNFKGMFGKPKRLVTDAVRLICSALQKYTTSNKRTVKFVLMNTAGNQNRDLNEPISVGEKIVVGLIRLLLPPHKDNENAADYLRVDIGQKNDAIEWVVVRPDSLVNEENVSEYTIHASPIRSAIFNSGTTSRINVGHFMADLITENDVWNAWKGQMPVIYNTTVPEK